MPITSQSPAGLRLAQLEILQIRRLSIGRREDWRLHG